MKKILNFFTEEIDDQEEVVEETKTERDIRNYMFNQEEELENTQELDEFFAPEDTYEDISEVVLSTKRTIVDEADEPVQKPRPIPTPVVEKEVPKMIRNQAAYEDTQSVKKPEEKRETYKPVVKSYGIEKQPVKKVEKPVVKEEPKKYKPRPFISPVHGIVDPKEKEIFYSAHKQEKRAVVEDQKFESKIETYERIRNKAFNTGPIEIPQELIEKRSIEYPQEELSPEINEYFEDTDLNVLEDVDFDAAPIQTDIDVEGKIFFDLVDEDLEEKQPNYLFTTQEIIGDDIKVTTIEDIDRAYARDGIEYVNDDNKAVNPFENTDEIDRENLLSLIDKLDDY